MIYIDSCNYDFPSSREEHGDVAHSRRGSRRRTDPKISDPVTPVSMLQMKHEYRKPLRHLQGKEKMMYLDCMDINTEEGVEQNEQDHFQFALELFNRKAVRKFLKAHPENPPPVSEMCEYFFDSVGRAKATFKLCVECRDIRKPKSNVDEYFMNLVEISQQRTILCFGCMTALINRNVNVENLTEDLMKWRKLQPNGILVDPYLLSCGY